MDSIKIKQKKQHRNTLILLTVMLLSACSSAPTSNTDNRASNLSGALPSVALSKPRNLADSAFVAEGKIALRYPECDKYRGCKQAAISAKYRWAHQTDSDSLTLYDPLGQQQLQLHYQGDKVTIQEGASTRTSSRDQLSKELGISIPIEGLRDWLLTPQPDNFSAQGWQIHPSNWQSDHYSSITLKRPEYYLKLLISQIKPE